MWKETEKDGYVLIEKEGGKTLEMQREDVPFDMERYVDSEGHTWDFGFGMDFSGVISDERTEKYGHRKVHAGEEAK